MMIISIGPAISASFDAPILLIESYHAYVPSERNKDAKIRTFKDLVKRVVISLYFLNMKDATSSNIIPASVMLTDNNTIGGK